ncbi:glycosyltransferase [Sphingomonas adhaesiva]|uniref:glycosyltransferase n=1 Tax=Sphingomonas adhaesiva TaxID=28212 RepID=UPI002FF65C94
MAARDVDLYQGTGTHHRGNGVKIAYLVHDVNDAAVRRRVALFEGAGHDVTVGGFHRDAQVPARIGDAPVTALGRTQDGALAKRALSVLRHAALTGRVARLTRDADTIVARNLETLVLAQRARRRGQRVVYECLDIHRLLLGNGRASAALHAIERWALRDVALTVVSAPAFRDAYFRDRLGYDGEVMLVENLVPRGEDAATAVIDPPPPPPWVIGWFGMLRCRRSFDLLSELARRADGRIEVVIAGRPSTDLFEDFAAMAQAAPHVTFLGGYTADDLPRLFGQIHFIWAIDYFEEGLNSTWLLPNRLYEGVAHGAVPLALRHVATGEWLAAHDAGVLLDDPARDLPALIAGLDRAGYQRLRDKVAAIPAEAMTMTPSQARAIADQIVGAAGRARA